MSDDPTGRREVHPRRRAEDLASGRSWLGVLAAIVAVALVGGALALVVGRSAALDAEQETRAERRSIELARARADLGITHLLILEAALFAELQSSELPEFEVDAFLEARRAGMAQLEELAVGDGRVAAEAGELLDLLETADIGRPPFDLAELDDLHFASIGDWPGAAAPPSAQIDYDARVLQLAPSLVTIDALAVAVDQSGRTAPDWAEPFVERAVGIVSDQPGWLGPDADDPFVGGYLSAESMIEGDPTLFDAMSSVPGLSTVHEVDQWLITTRGRTPIESAPAKLVELRDAAGLATRELRAAVSADLDARADAAGDGGSFLASSWTLAVASAALVAAAALAVVAFVRRRRRAGRLAEALVTDVLTGALNRRHLQPAAERMRDGSGEHHVAVVVDLDRFKLVNDTYGHDVGDQLLREVTDRLQAVLAASIDDEPTRSGAIVRLGGDEFLLLLHGDSPTDPDELERRLRLVEGPVDVGSGEPVELELSFGTASAVGPVELDELMSAADLNAYEDKRRRRRVRSSDLGASVRPDTASEAQAHQG